MAISWSFALNLITLIFSIQFRATVLATDSLSEALLSLKSELIDSSNSLHDWFVPSEQNPSAKISACSWSGVICTQNSSIIIGLDLSRKNLSGSISGKQFELLANLRDLNLTYNSFSGQLPIEIFNLINLRSLDISRNNFSGPFPPGISALQHLVVLDAFSNSFSGQLPLEISQLESLKVLNLAGSYFEGLIPPEYGSFKSLEFLHLAGNWLTGEIPPVIGKLKTVTHMEIGYNFYHGNIPWQLGNMSKLQYLDIADANLSGLIPDKLCNLTDLQSLFLFRNQFTGMIPSCFGDIISLINIDLSDNLLFGSIPTSFVELKNLRLLSLMYNNMSGSVPEAIAELPSLESLLIWNNFFSGTLPLYLGRNSKLQVVDVSTNSFSGSIPPGLCAGGKLIKLMLFANKFTGGLSPVLSNCSSLVRIRVEDNSFAGKIPLIFDLLPDISYVDLSRNRFTGGIPTDISKAVKLQYFNVSNNPDLGGTIPNKIWLLPLLKNFSASSCNISGNLPPFRYCQSISVIEMNGNHLSGHIPEGAVNCRALERIDLANNEMTGFIPADLATLPTLSVIDLSHNKFVGSIPTKFGRSSSLVVLNVSFNDISGAVPSDDIFRLMGASAFVGNPRLCGAPLKPCLNSKEIPHVSGLRLGGKISEKLTWVLLLSSGVVLFVIVSVFVIVYLHKGSRGRWKMVSFNGLPRFTVNDVLRSLNYSESMEDVPPLSSAPVWKAVLPTGITVAVKKIEWEAKRRGVISEFITLIGHARHRNLVRLLGFCYNKHAVYLLYDYLPNGNLDEKMRMKRDSVISTWEAKYKIVTGIARGLCYLHHECHPVIPHGDLKASNIAFDENMEPHLTEFGLRSLSRINGSPFPRSISSARSVSGTGEPDSTAKEICRDTYSFGEVLLEILTNGRMTNGESAHSKPREVILREIYDENEVGVTDTIRKEIKLVLEVALLCTMERSSDRPSMEDALRLLSGLSPHKPIVDFSSHLITPNDDQQKSHKKLVSL